MTNFVAVGSKLLIDNGRERRTDGLLKHLGLADVASFRVTGYDAPRSGRGTELIFYGPGNNGTLQAYDRDTSHYLDLTLNARNINLQPQEGGRVSLPAGTAQAQIAQYHAVTGWAGASNAGWVETVAQATGTVSASGTLIRLEACGTITNNLQNSVTYLGFGVDGSLTLDTLQACQVPAANGLQPFSIIGYMNGSAGIHRFAIWMYTNSGTGGFWGSPYTSLYVTEQRA